MKIGKSKDGGKYSTVWGWYIEAKSIATVVLLKFENGTREAFHNHAFNCISWILKGKLLEHHLCEICAGSGGQPPIANCIRCKGKGFDRVEEHGPSIWPVITRRSTFHKVHSDGTTWAISFRGRWKKSWNEFIPTSGQHVTMEHGRKIVGGQQ